MIKGCIIGDCHVGVNFGSYSRDSDIEKILWKIIHNAVLNKEVKFVVFLGDLFHYSNPIPRQIAIFSRIFRYLHDSSVDVFVLLGNHDQVKHSEHHALMAYENIYPDLHIIVNPISYEFERYFGYKFYFIPYGWNYDQLIESNFHKGDMETIVFSHYDSDFEKPPWFDINKIMMNFNGHIHQPSERGDFINVGSILPVTAQEKNDQKSYVIIELDYDWYDFKLINIKNPKDMISICFDLINNEVIENDVSYHYDSWLPEHIKNKTLLDIKIICENSNEIHDVHLSNMLQDLTNRCIVRNYQVEPNKTDNYNKKIKNTNPKDIIDEYLDEFCNLENKEDIRLAAYEIMEL